MSEPADPPAPAGGETFSSLFDFLPIGAYRSAPDGTMLRANPALVRLNGYASEAELLDAVRGAERDWYVDSAQREEFRRRLETDGQVSAFVAQIHLHKTRERIWVSENAHLLRDADGRVRYYEGTVEDVSERIEAEQRLRENEQRWKLALESAGDGVWDWDFRSGREIVSSRLLQIYGISEAEHACRPEVLDERTHPDDVAQMRRDREAHLYGGAPAYVNEHRMRASDGRWIWVLSRGMVIERGPGGEPLRMIGTHTDISERKEAESLRRDRDRAAAAQKAQNAFLSRVSHELRTPLNAIIGFAQLLDMERVGSPRQLGWIGTIIDSGRHLLALVNDLLDLSSAQTGQLQFTSSAVDLAALVREVWTMHAADANAQGLYFVDRLPSSGECRVQADPTRLRQVLSNLLSNAIKYNRVGGSVAVAGRCHGDVVELSVEDSGHGMDAAQLERLFNPFERLGAQHSSVSGTGLGLALAKQLVEAMGGNVSVHSTLGRGSTFFVRLSAART